MTLSGKLPDAKGGVMVEEACASNRPLRRKAPLLGRASRRNGHQLTLAVCSRIRRDGVVEIEIGLGDPRLPKSPFTAEQMRESEAASRARLDRARPARTTRIH
jgi:hypothetical protein